jgi:DNA polymerase elongation subunit (family B)
MELLIAVIGALTSVIIAIVGACLSIRQNIYIKNRQLKEEHYINYITCLHKLMSDNESKIAKENYTLARDTLFLVANENVVKSIIEYEEKNVGKVCALHDQYLTNIVKAIRNDLKIKDSNYPTISFLK